MFPTSGGFPVTPSFPQEQPAHLPILHCFLFPLYFPTPLKWLLYNYWYSNLALELLLCLPNLRRGPNAHILQSPAPSVPPPPPLLLLLFFFLPSSSSFFSSSSSSSSFFLYCTGDWTWDLHTELNPQPLHLFIYFCFFWDGVFELSQLGSNLWSLCLIFPGCWNYRCLSTMLGSIGHILIGSQLPNFHSGFKT